MTTLNEARESVYSRFETQWGTTTEFTFDNEEFTPTKSTQWARLTVRELDSNQQTLGRAGNRKFERRAVVNIQFFDALNVGVAGLDTLAELARTIFEGVEFDGLAFDNTNVREQPADDTWKPFLFQAFFQYDEIK